MPRLPNTSVLRIIGIVGTAVVLLQEATAPWHMEPRQGYGFIVLFAAGLAVPAMLIGLLPDETVDIGRNKDLLLPLALFIPLQALLGEVVAIPAAAAILNADWSVTIWTISLSLSLAVALHVVLGVIYAGWTTILIIRVVTGDRSEAGTALATFPRWFWRTFLLELIGWGPLFVVVGFALGVGMSSTEAFTVFSLPLIAFASLIWNLLTPALLPVGISQDRSLADAVRDGIRASRAHLSRWWLLIITQMVLLGCVTFIHVSYSTAPNDRGFSQHTKTKWTVSGFWTGGYDNQCRWHTKLMEAVEAQPLGLIDTLLGIGFAVLAIAIKLKIAGDLYRPANSDQDLSPDAGDGSLAADTRGL